MTEQEKALVERLQEDAEVAANVLDFIGGDDNEMCATELRQRVKEVNCPRRAVERGAG